MAVVVGGTVRASRLPVVVVLGATGTGKSKLALELAVHFKGEIISADSMQVYKGLDIITNKVTPEEAAMAPHHLLGFLDPLSRFTVTDFRNAALPKMESLLQEGKLPVVVGGTNYYIESLLWNVLIDGVPKESNGKLIYERDKELYSGGGGGGGEKKRDVQSGDSGVVKRCRVSGDGRTSGCPEVEGSEKVDVKEKESGNEKTSDLKEVKSDRKVVEGEEEENKERRGEESTGVSGDGVNDGDDSGDSGAGSRENISGINDDNKDNGENEKSEDGGNSESDSNNRGGLTVWQGTEKSTEELYQKLRQVDPEIADTYHPNERRKIIRSLQVWEQTGRPHSHLLKVQRQQEGGSALGGALRYPDAVIFWVTCEQDVLLPRLDARVDEMIDRGLLKELLDFHAAYNARRLQEGAAPDYTCGIFQSIGFKEFHEFLVLDEEERDSEKGKKLYEAGVTLMKLATRQYTKKQLKWIKNRFLKPSGRKVPPLYTLDATDPGQWDDKVGGPAKAVVQAMLEGRVPDLQPANPPPGTAAAANIRNTKTRHECEVCERVFIGEHIWLEHLRGAKHRKVLRRRQAAQHQQLKQEGENAGVGDAVAASGGDAALP